MKDCVARSVHNSQIHHFLHLGYLASGTVRLNTRYTKPYSGCMEECFAKVLEALKGSLCRPRPPMARKHVLFVDFRVQHACGSLTVSR